MGEPGTLTDSHDQVDSFKVVLLETVSDGEVKRQSADGDLLIDISSSDISSFCGCNRGDLERDL